MSTLKEKQLRRTVIEQATDWYRRRREGRRSADEQVEFLVWLRASPQNTHEYLAVARLWGGLKEALTDLQWNEQELAAELHAGAESNVHAWSASSRARERTASMGRMRIFGFVAASMLLMFDAVYYLAPANLTGRPQVLTATHDWPQKFRLDDGSVVHLNVNARVKVRYSGDERRIELERGQAFFDVAPETRRPFCVQVGAADVTAVGTRFDVARQADDRLTVTVMHGRVDVVSDRALKEAQALQLKAGQQVRIDGDQPSEPLGVDVRAVTAWMRHEVIFDVQPLNDVVREFNRYLSTPLQIEDAALREVEVSGVFDTYDLETFLIFLRQYNVEIHQGSRVTKISSKK